MEVRSVLAPNPGPFTGPGTNSYVLVSGGECVVLDPGPKIPEHLAAIRRAIGELTPTAVLVTHTHPDHAPAANPLATELGVPAFGHRRGPGFEPDHPLADGDTIGVGVEALTAVATPGHTDDHLCYLVGGELFTGDHIMGGSTVVIEDLAAYLESLYKLQPMPLTRIYPGHGPVIDDPQAVIADYIAHRLAREQQILQVLRDGAGTVGEVVTMVYVDVDPSLHPIAAHSVAAHMRKLNSEGRVEFAGAGQWEASVRLLEEA